MTPDRNLDLPVAIRNLEAVALFWVSDLFYACDNLYLSPDCFSAVAVMILSVPSYHVLSTAVGHFGNHAKMNSNSVLSLELSMESDPRFVTKLI